MNDHDGGVAVCMGMRVGLTRSAVGGPARVPETDGSDGRLLPQERLQVRNSPYRPPKLDPILRNHGDSRGVIPSVLQPLQAFHDQLGGVPTPDVSHYATHENIS